MKITREQALKNVVACVDDALSPRYMAKLPNNARLCVWLASGNNPLVVAVFSYLMSTDGQRNYISDDEAQEIAMDFLVEKGLIFDGELPDCIL